MADPIAWQGIDADGAVGLTSNPKIAGLWREVGRTVIALGPIPAPDQTNAEVSDERLREALPCPFCGMAPDTFHNSTEASIYCPNEDDCCGAHVHITAPMESNWPDPWPIATALWNRRPVTSQASEGEVVAWEWWSAGRPDIKRVQYSKPGLVPNRQMHPLYASPSKRVERLEAALRMLVRRSRTVVGGLAPGQSLEPAGANHTNMFIAAIEEADALLDQALQGGRS